MRSTRRGERRTASSCARSRRRSPSIPSSSSATSARCCRPRQVLGAEHGRLARRRLRLRARPACASSSRSSSSAIQHDSPAALALALADRGRGGRRADGRRAVRLGRRRPRGLLQPGDRADRRRGRDVEYLCVQDLSERSWILGSQRAQVGRDANAPLGRPRPRLRPGQAAHGDRHQRRGRDGARDRRLRRPRHAAPRLRHDAGARRARHDLRPRLPRHPARPGDRGLERHDPVDPGAQRTDAFQESRNLLLSDGAHADAIPGLEIEANDVRCTHAATVARLDEDQLFYLLSRGLAARRGRAAAGRRLPRGDRGRGSRTPSSCTTRSRPRSSASSRPCWPRFSGPPTRLGLGAGGRLTGVRRAESEQLQSLGTRLDAPGRAGRNADRIPCLHLARSRPRASCGRRRETIT